MRSRLIGGALTVMALIAATGCSPTPGSDAKAAFEKWLAENPIDGVSIEAITYENVLPGGGSASILLLAGGSADEVVPAVAAVCEFDPPIRSEVGFRVKLGTAQLPFACEDPGASVTTTLTVYNALTETGIGATCDVVRVLHLTGDDLATLSAVRQIAPAYRDDPQYGNNYAMKLLTSNAVVSVSSLSEHQAPLADDTIDVLDGVVQLLAAEPTDFNYNVAVNGAEIAVDAPDTIAPPLGDDLAALSTSTTKVSVS